MKENTALYAFEKYGDTVLRAVYYYTGNMSEAEDITQDTFLKLHTSGQAFNDDEHLKAWLLRVSLNAGKNFFRSGRNRFNHPIDDVKENEISEDFKFERNEITDMIMKLPEKYKNVIFLYYFEDYSTKEISEITEQKESTVRSLLKRGRDKLRLEMEDFNYEEARI